MLNSYEINNCQEILSSQNRATRNPSSISTCSYIEKIRKMGPLWKIIAESVGTDAKFKFAAPEDTVALWFLGRSPL